MPGTYEVEGRCTNPTCMTLVSAIKFGADEEFVERALKVAEDPTEAAVNELRAAILPYLDERERVTATVRCASRSAPEEYVREPECPACGGQDTTDMERV